MPPAIAQPPHIPRTGGSPLCADCGAAALSLDTSDTAAEFEDPMTSLDREYNKGGEYLSVHHVDTLGGADDAPDPTASCLICTAQRARWGNLICVAIAGDAWL